MERDVTEAFESDQNSQKQSLNESSYRNKSVNSEAGSNKIKN